MLWSFFIIDEASATEAIPVDPEACRQERLSFILDSVIVEET